MKRRKTYNEFRDFFEKYYIPLYKNDILEYYTRGIFCDISPRIKELDSANYDDWINSLKEIFEKDFSYKIQLIPDGLYSYDGENKDEINKLYDTILNKVEKERMRILFDTTSLENYTDEQKEKLKKIFNIGEENKKWACANLFSEFEKNEFDRLFYSVIDPISSANGVGVELSYWRLSSITDDIMPKSDWIIYLKEINNIRMITAQYDVWLSSASNKYMRELYSIVNDNLKIDNYQFDINSISDYSEQLDFVKYDIDMMLYILEVYGNLSTLINKENGVIDYLNKYLPEKGKVDAITVERLKEYIKSLDISQSNDVEDMLRISRIISNKLAHGYIDEYICYYISTGVNVEKEEDIDYYFNREKERVINFLNSDIIYELVDDEEKIGDILNKETGKLADTINIFSNCYSQLRNAEKLEEALQKCIEVILNPSKEQLEKCPFLETRVTTEDREALEKPDFDKFYKFKKVNDIFKELTKDENENLNKFCDFKLLKQWNEIIRRNNKLKNDYKEDIIKPLKKAVIASKLMCEILENAGLQNNEISLKKILKEDSIEGYNIANDKAVQYLQDNKEIFLSKILDSDKGLISGTIKKWIKSKDLMGSINNFKNSNRKLFCENMHDFARKANGSAIIKSQDIEKYCEEITTRIKEYLNRYSELERNDSTDVELESCFKEVFEKRVEGNDETIKVSEGNSLNYTEVKKKEIIREFKELYQEAECSGIFKNARRLFEEVIHQYSLVNSIFRVKNKITQVMLGFAANNDKKYFIEGKVPSIAETGFFNIYMDNIPQTNSCHCKWWEVDIDNTIKMQPREEDVEGLYQGNPDGLSLNTYMPWPRLTEEQIEGFKELLNVIEKVEKDEQIEEQTDYQATTYDELKKLKTDNPNSFKALKIRTILGSGINFYREYCKSNTVEKAGNEESIITFFHDQKSGAYFVEEMLSDERFMNGLSYVERVRESMRFINVLPKDKSSDEKQDDKSM